MKDNIEQPHWSQPPIMLPGPITLENKESTLLIQIESQDSLPFFTLTNKDTKETRVIEGSNYSSLLDSFPLVARTFHSMRAQQSEFLRRVNHPIRLYKELVSAEHLSADNVNFSNIDNPKVIFYHRYQANLTPDMDGLSEVVKYSLPALGMPILIWTHGYYSRNQGFQENLDIEPKKDLFGWTLRIRGVRDAYLSYASWDDVSGIKKLVELLGSPESTIVAMTLLHPIKMGWLREHIRAQETS